MLIYDETRMREPNLLIPYKKPIGSVRIDTAHEIGAAVRFMSLSSENAGNKTKTVNREIALDHFSRTSNDLIWVTTQNGIAIQNPTSSYVYTLRNSAGAAQSKTFANKEEYTVLWAGNIIPASVTKDHPILAESGSGDGEGKAFLLWVDDAAAYSGHTDTVSFTYDIEGGEETRLEGETGIATQGFHVIIAVYKSGGESCLVVDGKIEVVKSSVGSATPDEGAVTRLGYWAATERYGNLSNELLVVLNRGLNANQCVAWSRDPYQFLIPA